MAKLGVRFNLLGEGMSQVSGWHFNSATKIGNTTLAIGSDGLKRLGGETDGGDNIAATVETPFHKLNIPHPKRIRKVYVDYSASDPLAVVCSSDEDTTGFSNVLPKEDTEICSTKVLPGHRNVRGSNWKVAITNTGGADFSLSYVGILFVPLTRSRNLL